MGFTENLPQQSPESSGNNPYDLMSAKGCEVEAMKIRYEKLCEVIGAKEAVEKYAREYGGKEAALNHFLPELEKRLEKEVMRSAEIKNGRVFVPTPDGLGIKETTNSRRLITAVEDMRRVLETLEFDPNVLGFVGFQTEPDKLTVWDGGAEFKKTQSLPSEASILTLRVEDSGEVNTEIELRRQYPVADTAEHLNLVKGQPRPYLDLIITKTDNQGNKTSVRGTFATTNEGLLKNFGVTVRVSTDDGPLEIYYDSDGSPHFVRYGVEFMTFERASSILGESLDLGPYNVTLDQKATLKEFMRVTDNANINPKPVFENTQ